MRKYDFSLNRQNGYCDITYRLLAADVYDDKPKEKVGDMSSIIPYSYSDRDGVRSLIYTASSDITLAEYFKRRLSPSEILSIVSSLAEAFGIGTKGIPVSYLVRDINYIFVNPQTMKAGFVLLPLKQESIALDEIPNFFREVVSRFRFDEKAGRHIADMLMIINSDDYTTDRLKKYVDTELLQYGMQMPDGDSRPADVRVNRLGVMNNVLQQQPYMQPPYMPQQPFEQQPPYMPQQPFEQQPPYMPQQPFAPQPMPEPPSAPQPMPVPPFASQPMPVPPFASQPMPEPPFASQPMPEPPFVPQPMPEPVPPFASQPMPEPPSAPQPMPEPPFASQPMPEPPFASQPMPEPPSAPQPMPEPPFAPQPMPEPVPPFASQPMPEPPSAPQPMPEPPFAPQPMPEPPFAPQPMPEPPFAPQPMPEPPFAPQPKFETEFAPQQHFVPEKPEEQPAVEETAPAAEEQEKSSDASQTTLLSLDEGAVPQPTIEPSTFVAMAGAPMTEAPNPHFQRVRTGENIFFTKPEFAIGKSDSADYMITNNTAISRIHCMIVKKNGVNYIRDNGSTNHTYVDGVELKPGDEVLLKHGSIIYMADEEFVYLLRG